MPVLSTLRRENTPPRFCASSSQPFAADRFLVPASEDYPALAKEMRGSCIGPMDANKFFAEYMNAGQNGKPVPVFKTTGRSKKELLKKLQRLPKSNTPEDTFVSYDTVLSSLSSPAFLHAD